MSDVFRVLCAQLLAAVEHQHGDPSIDRLALSRRARAALAEGAGVEPTDDEIDEIYHLSGGVIREFARLLLARYGTHPRPIPVADTRYEFAVLDCEDEEQAGGSAATLADAIKEGNHYLALYSNDDGYGPYRLELREVRTLPAAAIPLPTVEPSDPNNTQPNT